MQGEGMVCDPRDGSGSRAHLGASRHQLVRATLASGLEFLP